MNRRGFVATIAGLLGALGLRGQEPCHPKGVVANALPETPECPEPKTLQPGEEYCPGWGRHAQKPRFIAEFPGDDCWWVDATRQVDIEATAKETQQERDSGVVTMKPPASCTKTPSTKLMMCSICGVVYVPQKGGGL